MLLLATGCKLVADVDLLLFDKKLPFENFFRNGEEFKDFSWPKLLDFKGFEFLKKYSLSNGLSLSTTE